MTVPNTFSTLTSNQLKASTSDLAKSLIILAGPGSGKTMTLTFRVAYMLNCGVEPKSILISTFTKKSANEMKRRLSSIIPAHFDLDSIQIGTFHSCALSFLRANANRVKLSYDFKIASAKKQQKIMKEVLEDYLKTGTFDELVIKRIKPLSDDQVNAIMEEFLIEDESSGLPAGCLKYVFRVMCLVKLDRKCLKVLNRPFLKVFEAYNKRMREEKIIDMCDILFLTVEMLENNKDVREALQNKYKFIIVDEFQDTNSIQFELLSLIGKKAAVTVCGDDDQAIYGWRGATHEVFEEFKKSFAGCEMVILNENFRSTGEIVKKSAMLIGNNLNREFKDLITNNPNGPTVEVIIAESPRKECSYIASLIQSLLSPTTQYKDISILYRLNRVGSEISSYLKSQNLPLRSSQEAILDKSERNLLSYLKLILDPNDNLSFQSVQNWPKRGLGDSSRLRIRNTASYYNLSYYRSLEFIVKQGKGKFQKAYNDLYLILSFLIKNSESFSPFEILHKIVTRYSLAVPENLMKAAEKFQNKGKATIAEFLDSVLADEDQNAITCSSIHQAKGQEWQVVVLARLNEGTLPVGDDLEEERRLAYVAATRARSRLVLSCCMSNSKGESIVPSRFLDEFFCESQEKRPGVTPTKELKKISRY